MKKERIDLWETGEYTYAHACGFMPNIVSYLHEDDRERPCILVIPGGGYCHVSATEGEIVADTFWDMGYNTFVLTYTINTFFQVPLMDQPLLDACRALRILKKNASTYHIDPEKIAVCGFSAGGHLAASTCVHFADADEKETNSKYKEISGRPSAGILSYPVIHSGEYAHQDSFRALLGADIYEQAEKEEEKAKDLLHYQSLDTQVTEETSPCFLWHTVTDELVPVDNSILFFQALRKKGIRAGLHLYPAGHHGLSVGTAAWANGRYGFPYTREQHQLIADCIQEQLDANPYAVEVKLAGASGPSAYVGAEKAKAFVDDFHPEPTKEENDNRYPVPEIQTWPSLANDFLTNLYEAR